MSSLARTPRAPHSPRAPRSAAQDAFLAALLGYVIWGILPLYYRLLHRVPPADLFAQRILWTLVSVALVLLFMRLRGYNVSFLHAFKNPKHIALFAATGSIIAANWYSFLWLVANNRVLESGLGYYMSPLATAFLGAVLLRETISPLQKVSVALAAASTVWLAFAAGFFPWISLLLALSFAFYGYLRKIINIPSMEGLFAETLLLTPLGVVLILISPVTTDIFASPEAWTNELILLSLTGIATVVPLGLFGFSVTKLRLVTVGLLMYVCPTMHFLLAVLIFGEPFGWSRAVAFMLVWIALAVYSVDALRNVREIPSSPK